MTPSASNGAGRRSRRCDASPVVAALVDAQNDRAAPRDAAFATSGLGWLAAGLCVTVLPLLTTAVFAPAVLKMNFTVLSGLLAGSMTDSPALAFAINLSGSDAPTIARH